MEEYDSEEPLLIEYLDRFSMTSAQGEKLILSKNPSKSIIKDPVQEWSLLVEQYLNRPIKTSVERDMYQPFLDDFSYYHDWKLEYDMIVRDIFEDYKQLDITSWIITRMECVEEKIKEEFRLLKNSIRNTEM